MCGVIAGAALLIECMRPGDAVFVGVDSKQRIVVMSPKPFTLQLARDADTGKWCVGARSAFRSRCPANRRCEKKRADDVATVDLVVLPSRATSAHVSRAGLVFAVVDNSLMRNDAGERTRRRIVVFVFR